MNPIRNHSLLALLLLVTLVIFTQLNSLSAEDSSTKAKTGEEKKRENMEFRAAICAHHISSGLWVVGRDYKRTTEEVIAQDIAPFTYFGWQPDFKYQIDEERKIVTVTAPGAPPRSARYTGDQGSTILPRGEVDVFFKPVKVPRNIPDASSQDWPMGEVGATTPVPDGVDSKAVAAALDWAMAQEEQNTAATFQHSSQNQCSTPQLET